MTEDPKKEHHHEHGHGHVKPEDKHDRFSPDHAPGFNENMDPVLDKPKDENSGGGGQ